MRSWLMIACIFLAYALAGCTQKHELGTAKNPIKLFFVPSVDAKVIESNSKTFKEYLEKNTPYKFEISIPQSFVAVVEAFGTKRADIAAINTSGYVMAHEKYGAEAKITFIRHGSSTYQSQFITKADGPIKSLADLKGKKLAFVDPISLSGYILPYKTLKAKGIEPKETVFAMKHDSVVSMIYQGQVDAGATFYTPPSDGKIEDARRLVLTQYPDVEKKVKIIDLSDPVPNDPIIFRKDMPEDMKKKVIDSLMAFSQTPEGKEALKAIYGVTELKISSDEDYAEVRKTLKEFTKDLSDLMKK